MKKQSYASIIRDINDSYGLGEIASITRHSHARYEVRFTAPMDAYNAYYLKHDGMCFSWGDTSAVFTAANINQFLAHVSILRELNRWD